MRSVDDSGVGGPSASDSLTAENIEAYFLTSLDSQWSFYEEQTIALHAEVASLEDAVASVELRQDAESSRAAAAMAEETRRRREEDERFSGMLRDKQRVERKFKRFAEVARSLKKELFEERAESNGLLKNLEAAQKRAEEGESLSRSELS
ncbi:hypothetical protein F5888DRAFT_1724606 [Russula emetica]|nr:hypothetical protein F5888DRAFT_1724606 [Russula emetica]